MTETGSLAPRPTPEPLVLLCPECSTEHVDEDEWAKRPHSTHRCAFCSYEWRPRSHHTVGVTTDDLHCMRLIHESHRIEAALRHHEFPEKERATESSFDRVLDALTASDAAGNELEDERDTARAQLLEAQRVLDRLTGLVVTLDERLSAAEDPGHSHTLDAHRFWDRAATAGLIDAVGGAEWKRQHAGTDLATPEWIDEHDRLVDAGFAVSDPPKPPSSLNDTEKDIVAEAERIVAAPTERPEFDQELCRLRAHMGLALTCMKSTHEGLIHEQTDSETGEPWDLCIVCDDQVVEGKHGHGGEDTCVAHDLKETLAHIQRGQDDSDTTVLDIGGAAVLVRSIEEQSNEPNIRAAAGSALLLLERAGA